MSEPESPASGTAGSDTAESGTAESETAESEVPAPRGEDFVEHVLDVVESIPAGHVMTYGDIAATIGSNAPRAVGKVMAYAGSDVPWWRVIKASGHPPSCHEGDALEHYRAEGTPLLWGTSDVYRIDLRVARYVP